MSILSDKTDLKAICIVKWALKVLETMSVHVAMTKDDDFELSLAINMLKSIVGHTEIVIIDITNR
jgi:hypothetical protein